MLSDKHSKIMIKTNSASTGYNSLMNKNIACQLMLRVEIMLFQLGRATVVLFNMNNIIDF